MRDLLWTFNFKSSKHDGSSQSGKRAEDTPPNFVVAFDYWKSELQTATLLVEDLKLAHSIARAVDSDSVAIEELRSE